MDVPIDLDPLRVERGTIDPHAYVDPSVYALEQERVFGRSWLFLTHQSQLPEPGRFVTATMGEDPVVVTRGEDGTISAFLNQCRHRGVPICRSEIGRSRSFTCSYHGWTYDGRGRLLSIPEEKRLFRCPIDREAWSATPVPRIEQRHGLVFGCWDPQVPSFEEWLGDARLYFDIAFDRVGGSELLTSVSRRRVAANWKFGAEQFSTDSYHVSFTHASGFIAQNATAAASDEPAPASPSPLHMPFTIVHSDRGHGMGCFLDPEAARFFFGRSPAVQRWLLDERVEYLVGKYGAKARDLFPIHMNFFPNTGALFPSELRVWQPRGPGQMEVWSWVLADRAAPDEVKQALRVEHQRGFGAGGIFEVDDMHNWTEAQRVLSGTRARQRPFNMQMGGVASDPDDPMLEHGISEAGARCFHRRWAQMLAEGGAS